MTSERSRTRSSASSELKGSSSSISVGSGASARGEGDALTLASGKVAGIAVGPIDQADQLEDFPDAGDVAPHTEGDVLADRQMGEQRLALRHQTDPAPLRLDPRARAGNWHPADSHRARVWPLEAGDKTQQGALARTARPEHRDELAGVERQ